MEGKIRDKKGRFVNGHVPWCKGTKGLKKAPKSAFKKGEHLGDKHPHWKGGRLKTKVGYIIVYCPNHPTVQGKKRNHVPEQILVCEKHLGRYLKPGEVVHHINRIKDDNRIENLIVMTNGEHTTHHHKGQRKSRRWNVSKEFLVKEYINNNKSSEDVAKMIGCCMNVILNRLKEYNIPVKPKHITIKRGKL